MIDNEKTEASPPAGDDSKANHWSSSTLTLGEYGLLRIFRNTLALAIGRNLNSLLRLVVASLIVRGLGAESFGIYSLIVALLAIADWLLDFGTTDVFVRELVRDPERYERLRKTLIALKLVQTPVSMGVMCLALVTMQLSAELVKAGLIACLSLSFFSGVAVYRSIFKATLTMEREMAAEFFSAIVMIPLVLLTARFDLGILGLMWSLFLSRAVFLCGCMVLARGQRSLSFSGASRADVLWLIRSSFVIGVIGFLIVINNSIELLLLSGLSQIADVAFFSAAQKLVLPIFMVLGALGVSYYPLLASQFSRNREKYCQSCQQLLNLTLIFGGAAICMVYSGAQFLLSILGEELIPATSALQILVVAYVIKSVAGVIGPVLYIVKAQNKAIRYLALALAIKMTAIYFLAPTYGFRGAALITLATEALFITPVTMYYVWRLTDFAPKMTTAIPVALVTVASIGLAEFVTQPGTFVCAVIAVITYGGLLAVFKIVNVDTFRQALKKNVG